MNLISLIQRAFYLVSFARADLLSALSKLGILSRSSADRAIN